MTYDELLKALAEKASTGIISKKEIETLIESTKGQINENC